MNGTLDRAVGTKDHLPTRNDQGHFKSMPPYIFYRWPRRILLLMLLKASEQLMRNIHPCQQPSSSNSERQLVTFFSIAISEVGLQSFKISYFISEAEWPLSCPEKANLTQNGSSYSDLRSSGFFLPSFTTLGMDLSSVTCYLLHLLLHLLPS